MSGRKHRYSSSTGRSSFWDDIIRAEEERAVGDAVENVEERLFEGHQKRSKQGSGSLTSEQHAIAHSAVVSREVEPISPKSHTRRRQHSIQSNNVEAEAPSGNSSPMRTAAEDDELERSGGSESSIVIYDDDQNLSDDEEPVMTRKETSKSSSSTFAPTPLRLDLSRINSDPDGTGKHVNTQVAETKLRPHALRQRAPMAYGPQLRSYRKAIGPRYLTPIMGDNPRAFVITTIEAMYFSGNTLYSQKWMLRYKNASQLGPVLTPWPSAPKSSLPDDFNPAELDDEIEVPEDELSPTATTTTTTEGMDSNGSTPRRASAPTLGNTTVASSVSVGGGSSGTGGTNTPPSPSSHSNKRGTYADAIAPAASDSPLRSSQSISSPTISPRVLANGKIYHSNNQQQPSTHHHPSASYGSSSGHNNNSGAGGLLHGGSGGHAVNNLQHPPSYTPPPVIDSGEPSIGLGDAKQIPHLARTANDLSSKRQTATTNLFTGILSRFKGRPTTPTPGSITPTAVTASGGSGMVSNAQSSTPVPGQSSTQNALITSGNAPLTSVNQNTLGSTNASVLARLKDKLIPWNVRRARLRTSDPNVTPEGLSSDLSHTSSGIDEETSMMLATQGEQKGMLRASLALPLHGLLRRPEPSSVMSEEEEHTEEEHLDENHEDVDERGVRRLRRSGARFNRSRSRSALTTELKTDAIRGPYFQRLQGMSTNMKDMANRMNSLHESAEDSLAELNATLERLNIGHERLDMRFKKLSRQMEDARNKTQSANALLVDNIQKSSNAIAHLKFKAQGRGPMKIVFAVLGWVVLLVGTVIWLVAAAYRAIARGVRWVHNKIIPSKSAPPTSSFPRRPHPTKRQGSGVDASNRMINITLGKQSPASGSAGSPNSARSNGGGHRRSMSSSAAASYYENGSNSTVPLSPTRGVSTINVPTASPSLSPTSPGMGLDSSFDLSNTRPNVPGVREGSLLRMSDDSGTSSSVNSTIVEENEQDLDSDDDDLVSFNGVRRGNLSNSSITSTSSSGTSVNTGGSVAIPVTSFAPNAAAAHMEAQQMQTLEDMSRSIKALRMQDKAAKRAKATNDKQIKPTLL